MLLWWYWFVAEHPIAERPVIALVGAVPMYRDIHPNDSGSDVAALKTSLNRLGFDAGNGSIFDERAERAVSAWFTSIGYEPFGATAEQLDRLKLATDTVRKSTDQVRVAREALLTGCCSTPWLYGPFTNCTLNNCNYSKS